MQTRLSAPDASRYHVTTENGMVVLHFDGRKFALTDLIRATFDDMCNKKSFLPGELSGPLDNDGKLKLVRYLHAERFLTLAD